MARSSSWSQIHKRLAEIIKILSSHQSLVIDILKSAFSVIDKRDYEKIEFIFDQLKVNGNRTRPTGTVRTIRSEESWVKTDHLVV